MNYLSGDSRRSPAQAGSSAAAIIACRQFFSLAIFAEWLSYMIASSTIFYYRRHVPYSQRPYKMVGYPVVRATIVLA
jgi:hypothetical protein